MVPSKFINSIIKNQPIWLNLAAEALAPAGAKLAGDQTGNRQAGREQAGREQAGRQGTGNYEVLLLPCSRNEVTGAPTPLRLPRSRQADRYLISHTPCTFGRRIYDL